MATTLGIFNGALAALGQRELSGLTEPSEARRVLQRLWDDNFANRCLETGWWNFAMRTIQATDDPPAPAFGYSFRVAKPTDWLKTHKISTEPTFVPLLDDYSDEGGYWYVNFDTIYVQYTSSHPSYGGNMAAWPESFSEYVKLALAAEAAPRLMTKQDAAAALRGGDGLMKRVDQALRNAKSKDATNQPPEFPPRGSWVRSRSDGWWDRLWDRR